LTINIFSLFYAYDAAAKVISRVFRILV
jgi:hypothetical protein